MKIVPDRQVMSIQNELQKDHSVISKRDIIAVCLCHLNGNYEPIKSSKLYQQRGGDYCRLLEVIEPWYEGISLIV